jgi:hypothetical protein
MKKATKQQLNSEHLRIEFLIPQTEKGYLQADLNNSMSAIAFILPEDN